MNYLIYKNEVKLYFNKKIDINLINLDNNLIHIPIIINDEDFTEYPLCFWSEILTRILHKKGISSPSRKSLELFMNYIKNKSNNKFQLKSNIILSIKNNFLEIEIK